VVCDKDDPNTGLHDEKIAALIMKARHDLLQYATPAWITSFPKLFEGLEDLIHLQATVSQTRMETIPEQSSTSMAPPPTHSPAILNLDEPPLHSARTSPVKIPSYHATPTEANAQPSPLQISAAVLSNSPSGASLLFQSTPNSPASASPTLAANPLHQTQQVTRSATGATPVCST
jgi:hypothetical protein